MGKKEIQEERMKSYFIDAVKKIVREKGVGELTVKKVAARAGYAPGTLYNYFNDLNELLFYSILEFFQECKEYVIKEIESSTNPKEKVFDSAKAYSCYFIENPNIYQLAFLENVAIPEGEYNEKGFVPEIVKITAEFLKQSAEQGFIKENDIEIVLGLIANSIHGNLLFYIKRRGANLSKDEVIEKIMSEVRYVINR